jgi:hypothetical protein
MLRGDAPAAAVAGGRRADKLGSMRLCQRSSSAWNCGSRAISTDSAVALIVLRIERRSLELVRRAALAHQDLDLLLGLLQCALTDARQLHAALEVAQRLVERQLALLELLDDRFELGKRALEIGSRGLICAGRGRICCSLELECGRALRGKLACATSRGQSAALREPCVMRVTLRR